MSLLTIAQDVAGAVGGIQVPSTVIGNVQARQLLAMIQKSAEEIASRHDWSALVRTHSFTADTSSSEQADSVPDDFDRFAGEPTMWMDEQFVFGPLGPGWWARTQAESPHRPFPSWRLFRGSIWFTPQAPSTDTVTYEYLTKNFVIHADDSKGDRFTADSDTTHLNERLIRLYAIAWWKHAKGLDYAEDMSTAERELEREAGRDGGGIADIVPYGRGFENPLGPRRVNAGALGILASGGYVEP